MPIPICNPYHENPARDALFTMKIEHITNPIEYKGISFQRTGFKQSKEGSFEAVVSTYGVIDSYGERVMPGAFDKSIETYSQSGRRFKVLWSHNPERPIGTAELISMEPGDDRLPEEMRANGGLMAFGQLAMNTTDGQQAAEHLAAGTIDEFSIGFRVMPGGDRVADDGVRELTQIDLFEVSPVVVGANRATGLVAMKGAFGDFDQHTAGIVELLNDYIDRLEVRYAQRSESKAGRVFSSRNVSELEALADTLHKARKTLLRLLAAGQPQPKTLTSKEARAILLSKGISLGHQKKCWQPLMRCWQTLRPRLKKWRL